PSAPCSAATPGCQPPSNPASSQPALHTTTSRRRLVNSYQETCQTGITGCLSASVIWVEDGRPSGPKCADLPDAAATAIVNSREDWLQRKIAVGLSLASLGGAVGSPCPCWYCILA